MNKINIDKTSYMGTYSNHWNSPISIGKYSSIGNGLTIISSNHPPARIPTVSTFPFAEKMGLSEYPKCISGELIDIGNDVWIGENVTIIAPVKIGNGAIIGAGSVVAHDVEPYTLEFGNPCKKHKYRFSVDQISALNKIRWWNWNREIIKERIKDFIDIEVFIQKYG